MPDTTIAENLLTAARILQEKGVAEPRREANSLLAFALGKNQTFLVAHSDYRLTGDEESRFQSLVARRAAREPLQYITGRQEFYGLEFEVTPDVLIPRPETELIVENAVGILRGRNLREASVCEVGIGSGCISVSILRELPGAKAVGLDVSEKALRVARRNAERHRVADRLELKISDVFAAAEGGGEKFDLIVSNPPYVAAEDLASLQPEVRDFEPLVALTDRRDGLSIVEKIIRRAPQHLRAGGLLLMEIGFDQSERTRQIFDSAAGGGWRAVEFIPDLQGIPRMVKAERFR